MIWIAMKIYFDGKKGEGVKDLIEKGKSGEYKKLSKYSKFLTNLIGLFNILQDEENTDNLKLISYLHYEKLKHIGLSSVRIIPNRVERLLFKETEDGITIVVIEINEKHYGNKK